MSDLEDVKTTHCGHIFHRTCLTTCFEENNQAHTCPFCRQSIFTVDDVNTLFDPEVSDFQAERLDDIVKLHNLSNARHNGNHRTLYIFDVLGIENS